MARSCQSGGSWSVWFASEQHAANLAILVGLLWLTQAGLARFNRGDEIESPVIQQDCRQRQSAAFELRQLFWVPLILPVAVENVSNLPLLAVTVQSLTFVGLPLLLGATFMTPRDRAQTAWRRKLAVVWRRRWRTYRLWHCCPHHDLAFAG